MGEVLRTVVVVGDLTPTLFSQRRFVDAVVRSGFANYRSIDVASMSGVTLGRVARQIYLSPLGLYAAPATLEDVTLAIRELQSIRNRGFRWVVRFDHESIAMRLRAIGVIEATSSTHVLALSRPHSELFASYSESRRRQVRKAASEGVTVRRARSLEDVRAYYAIHRSLSEAKGRANDYPLAVFAELVALEDTVLLVAERAGVVIGGAVFFRDGDGLFYWHGASDRRHAKAYATCAVFDTAIRMGCEEGRATLNFGASLGVSSLQEFKASWGATPRTYWKFEWTHRFWANAKRVRGRARSLVGSLRAISTGDRDAR